MDDISFYTESEETLEFESEPESPKVNKNDVINKWRIWETYNQFKKRIIKEKKVFNIDQKKMKKYKTFKEELYRKYKMLVREKKYDRSLNDFVEEHTKGSTLNLNKKVPPIEKGESIKNYVRRIKGEKIKQEDWRKIKPPQKLKNESDMEYLNRISGKKTKLNLNMKVDKTLLKQNNENDLDWYKRLEKEHSKTNWDKCNIILDIFKEVFGEEFEIYALTDIKNYKEYIFIKHQDKLITAISKRLYQMLQKNMITPRKFKRINLKVLYDPKKIISLIDFILKTFGYQLLRVKNNNEILLSISKNDLYIKQFNL